MSREVDEFYGRLSMIYDEVDIQGCVRINCIQGHHWRKGSLPDSYIEELIKYTMRTKSVLIPKEIMYPVLTWEIFGK